MTRTRAVTKARAVSTNDDRCTLCGYRSDGSFADRMRHLRGSHPEFARGLLLRLAAPFVFLVLLAVLVALHAAAWAYFAAMLIALGVGAEGVLMTRRDPTRTTDRPGIRQLLANGGVHFIVFGLAAAAILVLSTR